jgi:NADH-quinone oxidoreductase subunit L
VALAGVPFLFSGFWSKEAILHAAGAWPVSRLPLAAGLAGVALTAYYMTRLLAEVFYGRPRSHPAAQAAESPRVMTLPLVFLALGSVGLGFLGTPAWPWLQSTLAGGAGERHSLLQGGGLAAVSIALVAGGFAAGWSLYGRRARSSASAPDPAAVADPHLFAFLQAGMRCDEAYAATIGRAHAFLGFLAVGLDRWLWSGGIRVLAALAKLAGRFDRESDEEGQNAGFHAASQGLRGAGRTYSRAQTGETQGYLRALAVAFAVLAFLALWGGGG